MTTPIPAGIGYGTVRWTTVGIAEDGPDADNNPDAEQINGDVIFTANPDGDSIAADTVTVLPRPKKYRLLNGILQTTQGNPNIRLVGNDSPGTNPQGWSYTATYDLDDGYTFGSFDFYLPVGATVELAREKPVAQDGGVVITRGPAGPPGPGYGGGFVNPVSGDPNDVVIVSNWGVRDDGSTYYDPAGALPNEAALLIPDLLTGGFTLHRPGSPFVSTLLAEFVPASRFAFGPTRPSNPAPGTVYFPTSV